MPPLAEAYQQIRNFAALLAGTPNTTLAVGPSPMTGGVTETMTASVPERRPYASICGSSEEVLIHKAAVSMGSGPLRAHTAEA
jgi:hypothetical protein